jgi:hypothetical protein
MIQKSILNQLLPIGSDTSLTGTPLIPKVKAVLSQLRIGQENDPFEN